MVAAVEIVAAEGRLMYVVAVVEPAAPTWQPEAPGTYALFAPAQVSVTPVTVPAAVPVFVTTKYALPPAAVVVQENAVAPAVVLKSAAGAVTVVTWTSAVDDAEPKMPNTKPPIATAAIRVTAMISTVAMMGEMALRGAYFPCLAFIVGSDDLSSL